jgi:hypothetical protein
MAAGEHAQTTIFTISISVSRYPWVLDLVSMITGLTLKINTSNIQLPNTLTITLTVRNSTWGEAKGVSFTKELKVGHNECRNNVSCPFGPLSLLLLASPLRMNLFVWTFILFRRHGVNTTIPEWAWATK